MKNSGIKIGIIVLSISVLFIAIGYAAYSTAIGLTGIANVSRSLWSIHYDADTINVQTGTDGDYTLVSPTLLPRVNDELNSISFETALNLYEETRFTVDVVNNGTFSGRISDVHLMVSSKKTTDDTYTTLTKTGTNRWSNNYLDFYVVWTDGERNIFDSEDIQPSTSKNMTVVVKYKQPEDYTLLPADDMIFKFDLFIQYTQSSSNKVSESIASKVYEYITTGVEFMNALEEHANDDVILRIKNDIDLTNYDEIAILNNTTIEFNGNRLTLAPNSLAVSEGGYLLLEDSNGQGGISADRGCVVAKNGGTVVVNSGMYVSTNYTRGSVFNIKDGGKLIVNGGTINAAYYSIGSDGTVDITINGGELNSSSTSNTGTWAYSVKVSNGKFTMNGGKITGIHGGLALEGVVDAIINNGEIYEHDSESGANDAYYDVYATGTSSLKIKNGKFINDGTRSVIYTTSSNNINIEGGSFKAKGSTLFTGNNIVISGGKFSHDVSSYVSEGTLNFNDSTSMYEL